jgi:pimeloyl-ACP methyl ester carboxylesterase
MSWKTRAFRGVAGAALILVIPIVLLVSCQSRLIYFPRPYREGLSEVWAREAHGQIIDFSTSQGAQRAFLQGNRTDPRNLWIVCGGNATLVLEWSDWISAHAPAEDAWLLVEYPGYGDCSGNPHPKHIAETFEVLVPQVCEQLEIPIENAPQRLRFFGHSLGSAVALIGAAKFGIERGVLLSPFTSTMDMSRVVIGLPVGFLVTHRYDNAARLAEISRSGAAHVIILHGTNDEVIPVEMARQLATQHPRSVRLREIPGGTHNTLHLEATDEVAKALQEVGQER